MMGVNFANGFADLDDDGSIVLPKTVTIKLWPGKSPAD